jgi:hypothetical protein
VTDKRQEDIRCTFDDNRCIHTKVLVYRSHTLRPLGVAACSVLTEYCSVLQIRHIIVQYIVFASVCIRMWTCFGTW